MKIGFVGLGKMGLPLAVTMAMRGHDVMGFDLDPSRMSHNKQPYKEAGPDGSGNFNDWLARSDIKFSNLEHVVEHGDIIFVAVQTPHSERYEGITELPDERCDFNYGYLKLAIMSISGFIKRPKTLVIMSTVLPGTLARDIEPIIKDNSNISLVYNPSFIAMGTTMRDFIDPEFILVGMRNYDSNIKFQIESFYATICNAPIQIMSIESAELTKVAYNTYISLKIGFTNIVMEICEKFSAADCDDVMGTLKLAKRRLVSSMYMNGGMGDGGGCHPRDNIAMSWLAKKYELSYDIFEAAMVARQENARWLASMLMQNLNQLGASSIIILGVAFKPETDLDVGSPAKLVADIIRCTGVEPILVDDALKTKFDEATAQLFTGVFLIGCKHERYRNFKFAKGSIIVDPHRYIPDDPNGEYEVIRLGEARDA